MDWAQEDDLRLRVELKDGSVVVGRFVSETTDVLILESQYGGRITIPLGDIIKRETLLATDSGTGEYWPEDRNYSRYLWSPTAFALKTRQGYCADGCLFFPSFAWWLTDRFSVLGGMTVFPGAKIRDQLKYLAAKYTIMEQEGMAAAVGFQYFGLNVGGGFDEDEFNVGFGIAFATVTRGDHNNHFSASIGYGFGRADGKFKWLDRPIVTLSAVRRISRNVALVTENWLLPDAGISDTPLSFGIRFLGNRLSVNFAGIFTLSMFEQGLVTPFPWLDFSFHLGQ